MYRETKEHLVSDRKQCCEWRDINHTSVENQGDEIILNIMSEDSKKSGKQKLLGTSYTVKEAEEFVVMLENVICRAKEFRGSKPESAKN